MPKQQRLDRSRDCVTIFNVGKEHTTVKLVDAFSFTMKKRYFTRGFILLYKPLRMTNDPFTWWNWQELFCFTQSTAEVDAGRPKGTVLMLVNPSRRQPQPDVDPLHYPLLLVCSFIGTATQATIIVAPEPLQIEPARQISSIHKFCFNFSNQSPFVRK